MSNIAFLGTGAMGARMALNLLKAGHNVCVWNRNVARTEALAEAGARVADSPRSASENADYVISMVRDDAASKTVWCDDKKGALAGMNAGAIAIECSTITVEWARELGQLSRNTGIALLDAPVAGSRPQAEAAQLIFFAGGDPSTFEQAQSILEAMGTTTHYAGSAGAGSSIKLAVNALFGIQLAALAELVGLFNATGLETERALEILSSTPVSSPAVKVASSAMLANRFPPMFPIELVEKDFSYAVATAKDNGAPAPMTQTALRVFQSAVEHDLGNDNITGVVQLYR